MEGGTEAGLGHAPLGVQGGQVELGIRNGGCSVTLGGGGGGTVTLGGGTVTLGGGTVTLGGGTVTLGGGCITLGGGTVALGSQRGDLCLNNAKAR